LLTLLFVVRDRQLDINGAAAVIGGAPMLGDAIVYCFLLHHMMQHSFSYELL